VIRTRKNWLADDPSFLSRIDDLDSGEPPGADRDGADANAPPAHPSPPVTPGSADRAAAPVSFVAPDAPLFVPPPARPIVKRASVRAINAARALDPAHLLDTTPPPRPPGVAASPPESPFPTLMFSRASPNEPRAPRPLLELFPPEALQPERPPRREPAQPPLGPEPPAPLPAPLRATAPLAPGPHAGPQPMASAALPRDAVTYETFYGLREKPFSLSTDPRFHYQSGAHERAGHEVLGAIRKRGGAAILIGPLGMGKTILCRSLALVLDRRTVISLALDPLQSIDDLLKTLLVDFGCRVARRSRRRAASHEGRTREHARRISRFAGAASGQRRRLHRRCA